MSTRISGIHRVKIENTVGPLWGVILPSGAVSALIFDALSGSWAREEEVHTAESKSTAAALKLQLREYFAGERREFDLILNPVGTPFQKRIWQAISGVPYGSVSTYARLAEQAGSPRAYQAAGTATGQNPLPIIIPCHRILPETLYNRTMKHPGTLSEVGNYTGGIERKEALLQIEGIL